MGKKAKALLLNSDFTGQESEVTIEGGHAKIDVSKEHKYEFFTDRAIPIKVTSKKGFGDDTRDMYIMSWKSLIPMEFQKKDIDIERKDLNNHLKKVGKSQEEIEQLNKEIEKDEKEEGKKVTKFSYRWLEPVDIDPKKHWSKTELPAIVRETSDMRFLKQLKTYTEGGGGGGIGGKGVIIGIAVFFFVIIMIYTFAVALA